MGAETPPELDEEAGSTIVEPADPSSSRGQYEAAVGEARRLIASAGKDDKGRIKDDEVRWLLGDLMVQLWPRRDKSRDEAAAIQAQLREFARDVGYNLSMLKDFFYVAEGWPPERRVKGKSFAQHSKLRNRDDKAWALLGLDPSPADDLEPLKGLNKSQIRKVEKALSAIEALGDESAEVLNAVVARLSPKAKRKARSIIAALRLKEKEARAKAEALKNAKSPTSIIFDYQSQLLGSAARAQGLADLIDQLETQEEKDYVRQVVEGTVYVAQTAFEEILDALERSPSDRDFIETDGVAEAVRKKLAAAS